MNTNRNKTASFAKRSLLASVSGTVVMALALGTAHAQNDASASEDQELTQDVVIVTAAKREQTLQEIPVAVSVVGADAIEKNQVRDLADIQDLVPSLTIVEQNRSASTIFSIRGFGSSPNNVGTEPSVSVFIDGVFRSRSAAQIADLPNLERVEVLRGPQSTLFGKNASAGVISVVTRKPQFEPQGSASLSIGNYNAVVARADYTAPLSDTVAFSVSGNINQRDGYADDLGIGAEVNNRDRYGLRGQLLWNAAENLEIRVIGDYDTLDEQCCIAANIVNGPTGALLPALSGQIVAEDPFARSVYTNFESVNEVDNYGGSVQVDYGLDGFSLSSITAYRQLRSFSNTDADYTSADLIDRNISDVEIDTFTQEFRLISEFEGPFNFLAGAFYFDESISEDAEIGFGSATRTFVDILTGNAIGGLETNLFNVPVGTFFQAGQGQIESYGLENEALSLFAQADLEITDRLTLTAGVSYTDDEKQSRANVLNTDTFSELDLVAIGNQINPNANPLLGLQAVQFFPPFLNYPNSVEDGVTNDDNTSYTLRLAYDATDNLNIYGSYATGFKASSINLSRDARPSIDIFIPGSPATNPPSSPIRDAGLAVPNLTTGSRLAGPEESEVFELGVKGQWRNGGFNLAIFDQTITGFQVNTFTGTGFAFGNADEQSTSGVEFEGNWTPIEPLTLNLGVTYLDAVYDSFPNAVVGGNVTDLSGERPSGIPEFSVSLGGTYTHEFESGKTLLLNANYYTQSDTEITRQLPDIKREVEQLNASATLNLNDDWSFTVWGRNLTESEYLTIVFPTTAQAGSFSGYPSRPRTYGASVKVRF